MNRKTKDINTASSSFQLLLFAESVGGELQPIEVSCDGSVSDLYNKLGLDNTKDMIYYQGDPLFKSNLPLADSGLSMEARITYVKGPPPPPPPVPINGIVIAEKGYFRSAHIYRFEVALNDKIVIPAIIKKCGGMTNKVRRGAHVTCIPTGNDYIITDVKYIKKKDSNYTDLT